MHLTRGRNRGFISLRAILALLIVMLIIPLASQIVVNVSKLKFDHDDASNEIALLQLRRIMLISYDLENYGSYLEFLYHGKTYTLELLNNRLVLSPGYQMFLDDIDEIYFKEEGNTIFIEYERKGQTYLSPLTNKNGIYLDDFYDHDDGGNSDWICLLR